MLDIPCKWNHTVCGPLWVTSSTQHSIFKAHPGHRMGQLSIPFHGWVIFHHVTRTHFIKASVDLFSSHLFPEFCVSSVMHFKRSRYMSFHCSRQEGLCFQSVPGQPPCILWFGFISPCFLVSPDSRGFHAACWEVLPVPQDPPQDLVLVWGLLQGWEPKRCI